MSAPAIGCIIYRIANLLDSKCYVGQTRMGLSKRIACHKCDSKKHQNMVIYRAVRKYGWENFRIEVLESCIGIGDLDQREIFWIAQMGSMVPNGYNVDKGGNSQGKFTEETRRKMALAKLGKKRGPMSDETKRKIGDANRGRFVPESARKARSEWAKKNSHFLKLTPEQQSELGRRGIGVPRPPMSAALRLKMSKRHTGSGNPFFGKKHPPEVMARIKANTKPRIMTPEYRKKLSDAIKRGWKIRKEKHASS